MSRKILTIAFLALAGCATSSSIPEPQDLRAALNARFLGHPIQDVAARFGIPDSQTTFMDKKVFLWHRSNTMYWNEPVQSRTTGRVGDLNTYPWSQVPYTETTTSSQKVAEGYQCTLQIGVDNSGIVDGIGAVGKMGACQLFMP